MTRRRATILVAAAVVVPRLAALLHERGRILAEFTEKSDDFARNLVATGTYGIIPGVPSAYTQPLYGFFLGGVYWALDRSWWAVGGAQIALAVATALLVLEAGRRLDSLRTGVVAALVATLEPYLVWHDVHVNREIVDGLAAATVVVLALAAARRRTVGAAALLGGALGVAILGNSRLTALPLLVAAWLAWQLGSGRLGARRPAALAAVALVAASALVVTPWVVRNRISVGCFALTTDSKALWKANNEATYGVLDRGGWIDSVPSPPGSPPTPEMAASVLERNGVRVAVDECAQMRDYQQLTFTFWREHPGEKAKLAAQAVRMQWAPQATQTEGRPGANTWLDRGRTLAQPAYVLGLYAFALFGLTLVPRSFAVLAVSLLGYQTLAAMLFAGSTRYRAPWDFVLALLAAPAILRLWGYLRARAAR